jgi:nucleoside-diphosphate-sugar epimerase
MYAAELEALYADAEKLKLSSRNLEVKPIDGPLTSETVSAILEKLVKVHTGWETIGYSDNFYVDGMDSLQTLLLTRDMKQAFLLPDIAPSTVYTNPSIAQLSQAVLDISQQIKQSEEQAEQERKRAISETLDKKFKVIDDIAAASPTVNGQNEVSSDKQTVILTGSTGSLGSYLLFALLQSPLVSHIHCLNRGPDSQQAQKKRNASSGLPVNLPPDRVSFHTVDSAKENFGLEPSTYNTLLQTTTKIFLNGWSVNFNTPLSSFEQQIDSVINFTKFAKQANSHPTIFFVSSISSTRGLSDRTTQIPEEIIKDHSAPIKMGYGESKYVAERLLDYAAEKLHIDTRIARVGQIAGPVVLPGTWSKWEWFPSLVISSAHIGALPDSLGSGFDRIESDGRG